MDKNTLSNYGWIVIAVLVLSVMIALATPFGQYVENGVRATTEGLFSTSQNAMNSAFNAMGVEVKDQTFEEGYTGGQTGTTPSNPETPPTQEPTPDTPDESDEPDYVIHGVWEFNSRLNIIYTDITQNIRFTSNNKTFDCIKIEYPEDKASAVGDFNELYFIYNNNETAVYAGGFSQHWDESPQYQTVDFGAYHQEVSKDFYDWLYANASMIAGGAD